MKLLDRKLLTFLIIGGFNTVLGVSIMYGLYNLAGMSYWVSSAANYFSVSILSFFLNRKFTFHNNDSILKTAPRFAMNILICYLLGYGIAKPLTQFLLQSQSITIQENIAMFVGMCIFTSCNYLGQRFFAFQSP